MIARIRLVLKSLFALLLWVAAINPVQAADSAEQTVSIPTSIVTHNIPPLPQAMAARLQRYANARSAALAGWQGDDLLVYTRFGDTAQLHRVGGPLKYREQLTFLDEPVGEVFIPRSGANERVILNVTDITECILVQQARVVRLSF